MADAKIDLAGPPLPQQVRTNRFFGVLVAVEAVFFVVLRGVDGRLTHPMILIQTLCFLTMMVGTVYLMFQRSTTREGAGLRLVVATWANLAFILLGGWWR